MSSDGYRVVGVHGPPTKETAPHGFMWRRMDGEWVLSPLSEGPGLNSDTRWAPLPAPPVEQAPAPEPVAPEPRWCAIRDAAGFYGIRIRDDGPLTKKDAQAARAALNTLDRDGVVYGPGRPMSELPPKGAVLCKLNGDWCVAHVNVARYHRERVSCWWPLPESGE